MHIHPVASEVGAPGLSSGARPSPCLPVVPTPVPAPAPRVTSAAPRLRSNLSLPVLLRDGRVVRPSRRATMAVLSFCHFTSPSLISRVLFRRSN